MVRTSVWLRDILSLYSTIGYQCGLAYAVALMVYQIGSAFTGNLNVIGLLAAIAILGGMIYMLVRPYKEETKLTVNMKLKMVR